MIVYSLGCPVLDGLDQSSLIKSLWLRHYNIKAIVQKAAQTQEDQVTDGHDDDDENGKRKTSILRVYVTCVTAHRPPNWAAQPL